MGFPKGDVRRNEILAALKDCPQGLTPGQITEKTEVYEPQLTYYHLRVLMAAGLVVRAKSPSPMVEGRVRSSAFYYRLATEEEKRQHADSGQ